MDTSIYNEKMKQIESAFEFLQITLRDEIYKENFNLQKAPSLLGYVFDSKYDCFLYSAEQLTFWNKIVDLRDKQTLALLSE